MTTPLPRVSIVMPVRNERAGIAAALESVLAQNYDGPLEVVVADGASTDGTRQIVEDWAGRDERLLVVDNPAASASAGLNVAIEAASGTVIVRCDGHARLGPDHVRVAVDILTETGAANVGGRQDAVGTSPFQRAIAMAMTSPLGVGNSRFHYSNRPGPVDTVYLGAFDATALAEVGGFDETLLRNQDYELNHRLRTAGHTVWFDPRLAVAYTPRASLRELWLQHSDYGLWKRIMLAGSPQALRLRQLAPPLLVLGLIGSAVLTGLGSRLGLVMPGAYLLFLAVGTLGVLVRRRDAAALALPAALAVMHLGWGSGFLFRRRPRV